MSLEVVEDAVITVVTQCAEQQSFASSVSQLSIGVVT
jgi:hypothetical protein